MSATTPNYPDNNNNKFYLYSATVVRIQSQFPVNGLTVVSVSKARWGENLQCRKPRSCGASPRLATHDPSLPRAPPPIIRPHNYPDTVFQHQDLTKITGTPSYTGLALLERQCKANAQTVPSTIGNGNLGHLGLVSSLLAFERSSPGVPFVRPVLPILPDLSANPHNLKSPKPIASSLSKPIPATLATRSSESSSSKSRPPWTKSA